MVPGMSTVLHDLRQAIRGLRKRPGFLVAALLTLAIGIGANVTIFSIVNALLLRPLPFGDRSDRVVTLHSTQRFQPEDWDDAVISYADLVDLREQGSTLVGVGGFMHRNFTVTSASDAERLLGLSVTPDVFPLLGIEPMLGRQFRAEEGAAPGLETVVLLSHGLWQRRFGADPTIIGSPVVINDRPRTVVGVMPPGFKFPARSELFMPLRMDEAPRTARSLSVIGVLREGTSVADAQSEMDVIAARLASAYPASNDGYGIRVMTFRDSAVGREARVVSAALLAAVGFVLLIVCANLTNLLLVHAARRRQEMAVRAALGASRSRLVMGLLAESGVVAAAGTVLGILTAMWALDWMQSVMPEELPYWFRSAMDVRVLLFTVGQTAATTLAIGLWPALRASRPRAVDDLKDGGRGSSLGRSALRTQTGLAIAQVALCLALLVGANLMIRSFLSLQSVELGFEDGPVLTMRTYLAGDAFDEPSTRAAFYARAIDALRRLPGVAAAGLTTSIPGDDGGAPVRLTVEAGKAPDEDSGAQAVSADPELFDALGLTLIQGRMFTAAEAGDPSARVALVNARLARRLWPDDSPLEQRLGIRDGDGVSWLRVIGVAPDLMYEEPGEQSEQSQLTVYLPYAYAAPRTVALLLRSGGDPDALSRPAREALRGVDAGLAVYDVRTMREVRRFTAWESRLFGQMMAVFAGIALLLASLGIYAVLSYAARRRTHEMGVRVALGASPATVVKMLVGQAGTIGLIGLTLGLVLAVLVAAGLREALYGVDAFDAWMFARIGVVLFGVVLLAAYVPALAAARADPVRALRSE
jgi:predicted permease